ncbi:UNVERIFIED_CONTAM: Pentatricopeptide repeat-containing protein [Sesamum angustifolium]|uniref:Pentatricopeptide repeat-containing protein n=1 Tax=Sesamum angustifolium TaxID=2727405 RepID=A0AAW2P2G8_9LAMI
MTSTVVLSSPPMTIPSPPNLNPQIQVQSRPILYNVKPETGSLKSCKNLQEIKQLHGQFAKHGLMGDAAVLTKLIDKYSQMGSSESLEYAQRAFKIFKNIREDFGSSIIYLYNSLIRGSCSAGAFDEAILLYVDMLFEGVAPDNYTYPFVLSACAKGLRLSEGVQLHGSVVKMGFHSDIFVLNSLIYCYGECEEIDRARKVFDEMCDRNVVSWTSLICGYARRERHKEAVSLFFKMVEEGIEPNEVTMVSVISACAKLGDMDCGERVLDYVGKSGITINTVMVNALVDMYMKCGAAEKARQLFDQCVDRNLVLYNTLMSNYVKLGKVKDALDIFCEMLDGGPKPDRVTMLSIITSSAELGFARNGDVESAQGLFNEMPERDIVSWNTMIGALVQQSFFRDAIELFHSMQNEGIMVDEVTMVSVASACGYLGALDLAKWTYNYIKKYEIHCNMRLNTALVDMFARCGDPQNAIKVFSTMKERDVSAWTAAIGAMAMEGNGERAFELFHEMLDQGVVPDEVVFSGVLTACSHAGLVKQGMQIFNSMKEHGITPHIIHYGCVVDLLGRAGFLDEALDFINTMPMEPNGAIWGAFLAACRIHKNEKMATCAAELITKSAKDKTGVHVLLSNIYASAAKWDDVAKVRMQMKEKGMRKTPGSSSVEVNGAVHEFTSGDEFHPENALTASMLQEINCRLKHAGYVPDLTNVLLDIDEQEKEFLLNRHSEKLAIAFGLVSSSQGMPIRVVKNLRMCSDCHSFAKMVSRVYNREIVIRDNNKVHFFWQGSCSCRDYW